MDWIDWEDHDPPAWARHMMNHFDRRLDALMTEQAHVDADVAQLTTAVQNISSEIASLKQANPAVDFSGLDAAVAAVQALAPAAPSTPAAPADGSTAPPAAGATSSVQG